MATSVGLNFRLTAAVDKFEAGMKDVEKRLNGIERSSKQTASGMKLLAGIEVGKLLVGGLTKVFNVMSSGISTVTNFADATRDVYDKVGKLSAQTGMAAEPLQVLQQISKYAGLELDSFRNAAQKMSRSLGDAANGTGTAGKAIERMGLDLNQLLKMSPSQQFITLGEAIASIKDPATRSAEAANIFGRNGMIMIPMFEDLAKNVRETGTEMLELGQILSRDQVSNIEAMNDSFEKVKKTAFSIGSQVIANFAPAITQANEKLLEFIKNFQFKGEQGGQAFVKFVTEAFMKAAKILADWADAFILALTKAFDKIGMIFDRLSDFLAKYLGMDRYASGGANEADQRILAIDSEIANYERLIKNQNFALEQQMTSQEQHDRRVAEFRKKQNLLWAQRADAESQILRSEQAYYEGKKSSATGMASIRAQVDKIADGLATKITTSIDAVPSKLKVMSEAFQRAAPAVGRLEQAAPGFVSKAVEFGGKLFDAGKSLATWGNQVIDQSAAGKDLALEHRGLVRAGVVTQDALDALAFAASGTGSSATDAKLKLYDLADSAKQLQAVQDRLKNKFMSPFEQFANNRQQILEAMGFNPFYVEEQKRIWLEKQQNAVDKQIEQAKDAYMKFKERMGESIDLGLEDLNLDLEETLPELQEQTGILTGIKQIFDNAAPLLSFQF